MEIPDTSGRPSLGSSDRLLGKAFSSNVSFVALSQCRCKRGKLLCTCFHLSGRRTVCHYCTRFCLIVSTAMFDALASTCMRLNNTRVCLSEARDVESRHETTVSRVAAELPNASQGRVVDVRGKKLPVQTHQAPRLDSTRPHPTPPFPSLPFPFPFLSLCTMDDANCFHMIRLGSKTSVNDMNVTVVSTATGCDVTYCATTLQGFNKQ